MTLKGLGRKLLLVLLGLVGCALLVVALLPYIVSLESVRGQIVGHLEAALHRKVDVGAVRLQLLSGLGAGLEDVTIYNPPGWQQPYVMKAASLSIKVAWRPFLQRRIEITKMILRDGEIVIERDAQGRLNVAAAGGATPASTRTLPTDVHRSPSSDRAQSGTTPLAGLRVAEVTLQNMPITFIDRVVVPGQAIVTAVSDFQLHLRDVALGTPIPIDMTATMLTEGSRNVRLRGSIGPVPESLVVDSVPIDVHLQTTDMRLDKLAPYLGRTFPLVQGRLGGEIKLQGSIASNLRIGGNLSLADAALREGVMSEAATALPTLTSTQDITVDLAAARGELTDVEINVAGIQVTIKGVVHTFTTTPQLDLQVATNTFPPVALLTQLPMLASMIPTPTDVRGNVQLLATVKGAPHDLRAEAQIDLQEIVLKSGAFSGGPPAGGGMLFETDKTEARLATQVVKADPPRVHIDVRAQRLVFDQQRPHTSSPNRTSAPTATIQHGPTPPMAPSQPMLPAMTLSGQVSIAEGRIRHLNFQQMTADFSLVEGLLQTTQQMQLYGGSYHGVTQVDLTHAEPSYTLDARVAGLHLGPALDDLTPAKNTLLGVLDTDMRLAGRGVAWDVIQKTLSGDGHVKIADAQLTHVDLFPKLMHLLQNMGGLAGFTRPSAWEQNAWRTIEGDWRLQQGKILTDHLRLRREGVEALLSGHVGLDQALEYRGTLFLPAKITARRGAARILRQDEAGRLMLPFTVQGTVSAPRLAVDANALGDVAKEELVDTVRKRLGGKIDELLGQPSTPDQPRQESEKIEPETDERSRPPRSPGKILQDLFRR
jgi:AsmA-like C-terminal region/Domain of Unknown Function (DUF748)